MIGKLDAIWASSEVPFLIHGGQRLRFADVLAQTSVDLSDVRAGDVVALIGDFDPLSIMTLLRLIDLGAIVVPLTGATRNEHPYYFETAFVDVVIEGVGVRRRTHNGRHELLDTLRARRHPGLVLFSTGTTGRPKAILHDLALFLKRFETPRPTLRTLNFLLFDHVGGINTLLHTLFNRGVVVTLQHRTVDSVLDACRAHDVELLPTTPTFLRLMLMSGAVPDNVPACLKVITYGTERMDQPTLDQMCGLLPSVDFRQTFGMSELGIVRVRSTARNSLFMKVGGEGVQTRVVDGVLQIRSASRMLGYLNAASPFDDEGWYNTKDLVEIRDGGIRVVGRASEVINVGGLKFLSSEIERVVLTYPNVALVKVTPRDNPITGQHVEMTVQPTQDGSLDKASLMAFLKANLRPHMMPKRIRIDAVQVGHRFKRA